MKGREPPAYSSSWNPWLVGVKYAHQSFATVELSIRYFKSVHDGVLEARARQINRSSRLAYLECDIINEQQELVARLASTCMFRQGVHQN